MTQAYKKRLEQSFWDVPVLPVYPYSKIVLFSDCHRGVGNANDNFLKNQNVYFGALRYYYEKGFTYIELGDGDELWENRSFASIREIHSNVFWLLSRFQEKNRLYMIYGNHDAELKECREFPHYPGIVLRLCGFSHSVFQRNESDSGANSFCRDLYLTHGHQADTLNSVFWKLSRFLVRYFWQPLEQKGVLDPTSAAKNYKRRKRVEERLAHWAEEKDCYLITGHTHRPMLESGMSHYFNTGSCVHPRCITCMELEGDRLCLVKWHVDTRADRSLFVNRTVLAGPDTLGEK